MLSTTGAIAANDPRAREAATTLPVYGQLPFVPERAAGCDIVTNDGRRILDLYGGHAVAALGYGHPRLTAAITEQSAKLLFQSNAVALEIRAQAAEKLIDIAPDELKRVFFVNSGAEANENALRMACVVTKRKKILAIIQGFHGRTAAAGAVTWNSQKWYGFPSTPFDVEFIPRDDCDAAAAMIGEDIAAVIVEPVQGVAGAYDLSHEFLTTLRKCTRQAGALLIADEVQSGIGRSGQYFAVQSHGIAPDILTAAKALGGGVPCGAVFALKISPRISDLATLEQPLAEDLWPQPLLLQSLNRSKQKICYTTSASGKHRFANSASRVPCRESRVWAFCSGWFVTVQLSTCATLYLSATY